MVEGGGTKEFARIKAMMFDEPRTLHTLLDVLARSVSAYLNGQIAAGAQAVMLFDTWGGVLSPQNFKEFSLKYMTRIVGALTRQAEGRRVPVILFTKNGGPWLEAIADSGCDGIGIDWTTDLGDARRRVGERCALQGNLDTAVLYASAERIAEEVGRVLAAYGHGSGHVFNLGHGIHPQVDPEKVSGFIDAVHELSVPYHTQT